MRVGRIERESDGAGIEDVGPLPSIASVRFSLNDVATEIDARFVKAGGLLTHMIETIDQMVGRLDAMHEALSPDEAGVAVVDLREAGRLIADVPARSAARENLLNGICKTATLLEQEVQQTLTILKALRILSVNIRIATMDEPSFKHLVNDIVARLSDGEQILSPLSHIIAVLTKSLHRAMDAVRRLAGEAQKVMPLVPPQLERSAGDLDAYREHVTKSASSTASVARDVQMKVASVLGALQIGDTTRQRIEHVIRGLQLLEDQLAESGAAGEDAGGSRRAVLDLLSDQLSDASGNLQSDVAVLLRSLTGISGDAGRLRSASGENDAGTGGPAMLQDLHKSIRHVSYLTQQVRSTNAQISQIVGTVFSSLNELRERIQVVRKLRDNVEQIAINVRLKCHRDASAGKAVEVIASEVRSFSLRLHDAITRIAEHLETLTSLSQKLLRENEFAEQADIGAILERSTHRIGIACDKVDAAIDQAARDSSEAVGLINATTRDLADHDALARSQQALAVLLAEAPDAGQAAGEAADTLAASLMEQIARSYTMAREREIHQRHGTIEMAPAAALAIAADDDDLDGLFL